MMKTRSAFRGAISKLLAAGLIVSFILTGCTSGRQTLLPGAMSSRELPSSTTRTLQSGFHHDDKGRLLIWIPGSKNYRAVQDGIVLRLNQDLPSAADFAALKAALEKLKHRRATKSSLQIPPQPGGDDPQAYCQAIGPGCDTICSPVTGDCVSIYYIYNTQPVGELSLGPDGMFHDILGGTWGTCSDCTDEHGNSVPWIQQIGSVQCTNCPLHAIDPAMEPYVTAYNGINVMNYGLGIADFLAFVYLLRAAPVNGLPPYGTLAATGGVGAAFMAEINQMEEFFTQLEAEVGPGQVTLITSDAANAQAAAAGYTVAPFLQSAPAAEFATVTAQSEGMITGSQLVQFASDATRIGYSPWVTTMDEVIDQNGNMLSATEIADKFSLNYTPTVYAAITNIQVGVNVIVGKTSAAFGGTGGGIQYWFTGGAANSVANFAPVTSLGH